MFQFEGLIFDKNSADKGGKKAEELNERIKEEGNNKEKIEKKARKSI